MKETQTKSDYEWTLAAAIHRLDALAYALGNPEFRPTDAQLLGIQDIVEGAVKDLRSIKGLIDGRILLAGREVSG